MDKQEALHEAVASANNLSDLLPMIQCISINKIKNFIDKQIDEMDNIELNNMYYQSNSINEIFADDIIQYILYFAGIYHTRIINKKWKLLSEQNETIHLKQLYKSVSTKINKSPITYDKNVNNIWVIHHHRNKLHQIEINAGFSMTKNDNNIYKILTECKSGDVILIHNGFYILNDGLEIPNKNIHIIGLGSDVIIYDSGCAENRDLFCGIGALGYGVNTGRNTSSVAEVHIENIKFNCGKSDASDGAFYVTPNSKLWVNDCIFAVTITRGINVQRYACLNVENCQFIGGTIAIEICPLAKEANIMNCVFRLCGIESDYMYEGEGACILVTDDYYSDNISNINLHVRLKCVENLFENNACYPIAERHIPFDETGDRIEHTDDESIINAGTYVLKNNVLKGYNATKVTENVDIDANTMYYNNVHAKVCTI